VEESQVKGRKEERFGSASFIALETARTHLAAFTAPLAFIAALTLELSVALQGCKNSFWIASFWRSLALPTLSCATARVLRLLERRPGPTSTAPEAAARERAWGRVF
jgi:hypothetical protein